MYWNHLFCHMVPMEFEAPEGGDRKSDPEGGDRKSDPEGGDRKSDPEGGDRKNFYTPFR